MGRVAWVDLASARKTGSARAGRRSTSPTAATHAGRRTTTTHESREAAGTARPAKASRSTGTATTRKGVRKGHIASRERWSRNLHLSGRSGRRHRRFGEVERHRAAYGENASHDLEDQVVLILHESISRSGTQNQGRLLQPAPL